MSALPSIIAMKHSHKHRDDLNVKHKPTLREKLEAALWVAEQDAKQGPWDQAKAERGELRAANIKTSLALLDAIEAIIARQSIIR